MKTKIRCFIIVLCLTFCQAASAGSAPDGPTPGDALLLGALSEPTNLIPFLATDAFSHQVSDNIFQGLLQYDKDLRIAPCIAKSFEVLDGGLKLRFALREDIFWEDGEPLTVDDVEFTYRLIIDPATGSPYSGALKMVKEFRKLGKYSFEVTYDKPFARSLISWMTEIMPKHLLEGQDVRNSPFGRRPTGCGPFRLKEWKPGSSVTLEANNGYFEGRPYLDGLVFQVIPDSTTMFMELRAGAIDAMVLSPQQYVYSFKREEDISEGGKGLADSGLPGRFNIYKDFGFAYTYMGYNLKNPLFSDVRVRRAFAMAINKEDVVKGALAGQGVPVMGPYSPSSWAYNDELVPYPHDPEKAAALLAECGWTAKGSDGILLKDGKRFSFTLLVNQGSEVREKTAIIIQSQLRAIGVDVRLRVVEWTTLVNEFINKGRFEALIMGWTIPPDPDGYDVWHSSRAVPGGLNFVGYANPEVDALLEAGRSTLDQAARKEIYKRFQAILHEDQPYCFLFVPYEITAVDKRFQGIVQAPAGITYNLDRWWVPAARQRYKALLQP